MFRIKVPATSANMGPAFDTAGVALSLYNTVEVFTRDEKKFDGDFHIESVNNIDERIRAGQTVPTDERNLLYRTVKEFEKTTGKKVPPFYFKQTDEIPLARGLGSSAACITAGLAAANRLTGNAFSKEDLLAMAVKLEGHPDNVAPALLGDFVVGAFDGERLEYVRADVSDKLEFIVLIPDFSLSTKEARGVLPENYTRKEVVFNISRAALLTASIMSGNFDALSLAVQDRIHQPYRKKLIPGMEEILSAAENSGAYGGYLSGAGPTLMIVNKKGNSIAGKLEETVSKLDNFWLIKKLDIEKNGLTVTEENL